MSVDTSGILKDIHRVFENAEASANFKRMEAVIHTPRADITTEWVELVDTVNDYIGNYGPAKLVSVKLPADHYTRLLFPYRDRLLITLTEIPLLRDSSAEDTNRERISRQYIAILGGQLMSSIPRTQDDLDPNDLSTQDAMTDVDFELIEINLSYLQTRLVAGTYRNAIPADVVKGLITSESQRDQTSIKGVHMIAPDNQDARNFVTIPEPRSLISLAEYIQEHEGGIYSTGISTFLQDDIVYISPVANYNRYESESASLTIVDVPKNRFPGIDRSYVVEGSEVTVIANGTTRVSDSTVPAMIENGNSVIYANADEVISQWAKYKDGDATTKAADHVVRETVFPLPEDRSSLHRAQPFFTTNKHAEWSKIAMRQGMVAEFEWGNGDARLIRPMMPVRVLHENEGKVREIFGVVIRTHTTTQRVGTVASYRHENEVNITVLLKRD